MALVLDIETIGEDFETMDEISQHVLTSSLEKNSKTKKEYEEKLMDLKNSFGLSPLTGEIVALGVIDSETEKGAVYFQAPEKKVENLEEGNISFKVKTENEMLEQFWKLAPKYNEFVTFNGKRFDIPYLILRSAINKIKPTKNLMSNRYLYSQKFDAKHIDLYDELTFYGAANIKGGNLHMFTRAFGIESPKRSGIKGDDVGELFKNKKYLEIAKYNSLDIIATKKLFDKWTTFIKI